MGKKGHVLRYVNGKNNGKHEFQRSGLARRSLIRPLFFLAGWESTSPSSNLGVWHLMAKLHEKSLWMSLVETLESAKVGVSGQVIFLVFLALEMLEAQRRIEPCWRNW